MDARSVVFALACVLVAITDAASAARGFPGKDWDPGKKSLIRCTHTTKAMNGLIALPSFLKDMVGTTTDAMEVILLFEDNIPIISSVLPSETKFSILDCLGKKNLALFEFGGDPEIRGTKYIIIFFSHRVSSRRYLTDSSSKVSSSFSNGPAIATTSMLKIDLNAHSLIPASTRTTNPFFVPDSGPINFKKPAYSLKALSSSAPVSRFHAPVSRFHVGNPRPISPAPAVTIQRDGNVVDVSPASGTFTSSEKHNDSTEAVINAVVITGTVSFALSAIFFYCYIKCCATSRSDNAKSERPLLSLSDFSDVSLGSSPKSFAIGTVMHGDMVGITSLRAHQTPSRPVSSDPDTSLSDISSYVDVSDTYKPSVGIASSVDAPSEPSCPPPPPPPLPQRPPTAKMAPPPNALPPPMINPCPPPPPKGVLPPHPPPPLRKLSPLGPNHSQGTLSNASALGSKTKLKPFFWDKVMANPDQTMVWHQIKSGSFQFNEEMIETLFRYNVTDNLKSEDKKGPSPTGQIVQIIDPKKSQNLAILLRALNMASEDVCLALTDGNELPRELIQTLLKMPPTVEEELKLKLYTGDITQLHTAERLLKALMDIPFAYKRLDSLLFMCSFHEDVVAINESLKTLKAACRELRSSRLFLKLLEAVLKTGNRMNDGTYRGGAQAFKLDTLLKLSDVKGIDGKTTLLHFVVQEIIRTEGIRAARATRGSLNLLGDSPDSDDFVGISQFTRNHYYNLGLKIVSSICDELGNVKKAAALDADTLTSTVANLGCGMTRTKEFLYGDMNKTDSTSGFQQSLQWFVEHAEGDIISLQDEEKSVRALVRSTTDYFHGNAGKDEGLRLFVIVRNFLGMLEKVCNEVRQASVDEPKVLLNKEVVMPQPVTNPWQPLFPAIQKHRLDISSSDEDSS